MRGNRTYAQWTILAAVLSLAISACSEDAVSPGRDVATLDQATSPNGGETIGALFVMSNAASGNEILVFSRSNHGMVAPAGSVPTGGLGTGGGLGNQESLLLSDDPPRLFAVNAGSDDISVLSVDGTALQAIGGPVASGGERPISLTAHGDLLYVLNAGGAGNITGFRVGDDGSLNPIAGSERLLSSPAADPAEIQFSPDSRPQDATFTPGGRFLYVRNAEGTIGVVHLDGNGALEHLGNFGALPDGANGIAAF